MVLISIEGLDGSGKTTLAAALAPRLPGPVELLREPGGVVLAERVRELVRDPELTVDPAAEALLFAAARAQLVAERIRPLLATGATVILDRFVDSSLAYQGAARGLGVERVRAMNDFGVLPDMTLLLRIAPGEARARWSGERDRMEREPEAFFAAVADAYDALAAAEPGRFRVLDATLPPDRLLSAALEALSET